MLPFKIPSGIDQIIVFTPSGTDVLRRFNSHLQACRGMGTARHAISPIKVAWNKTVEDAHLMNIEDYCRLIGPLFHEELSEVILLKEEIFPRCCIAPASLENIYVPMDFEWREEEGVKTFIVKQRRKVTIQRHTRLIT